MSPGRRWSQVGPRDRREREREKEGERERGRNHRSRSQDWSVGGLRVLWV